ncbi:MAG: thioredoxin family protein [Syntrophorhabdaceae bacterium]|nr:thioredoxin family protein [Syntrophorhabdaceae bacterium]
MKSRIAIFCMLISIMVSSVIMTSTDVFAGEVAAGKEAAATLKKPAVPPAAVQYPALIDVGAKQCIPCKMMEPVLEELKAEYAGLIRVEFIDVQVDPQRATKLGVRGIPTQIFYDASGKERARHMGYISKENILKKFKQLGIEAPKKSPAKKTK